MPGPQQAGPTSDQHTVSGGTRLLRLPCSVLSDAEILLQQSLVDGDSGLGAFG